MGENDIYMFLGTDTIGIWKNAKKGNQGEVEILYEL
jgi:hypothetical protein